MQGRSQQGQEGEAVNRRLYAASKETPGFTVDYRRDMAGGPCVVVDLDVTTPKADRQQHLSVFVSFENRMELERYLSWLRREIDRAVERAEVVDRLRREDSERRNKEKP
jgi:hypothetical protein